MINFCSMSLVLCTTYSLAWKLEAFLVLWVKIMSWELVLENNSPDDHSVWIIAHIVFLAYVSFILIHCNPRHNVDQAFIVRGHHAIYTTNDRARLYYLYYVHLPFNLLISYSPTHLWRIFSSQGSINGLVMPTISTKMVHTLSLLLPLIILMDQ